MADPTGTKEIFLKDDLSSKKLRELVVQHNAGVRGDHAIASTLDAEGAVAVDNDYEAQLTALEVRNTEGAPTESATAETFDLQFITEALLTALATQMYARVDDLEAIVAKLNLDDGIAAADYAEASAKPASALGLTGDAGADLLNAEGFGASGRLLQHLTELHDQLETDWHAVAVKLDADAGLASAYEAVLAAEVLTEA